MSRVPLIDFLHPKLAKYTQGQVFFVGIAVTVAAQVVFHLLAPGKFLHRVKGAAFRIFRTLFAPMVNKEIQKAQKEVGFYSTANEKIYDELPKGSRKYAVIVAEAKKLHEDLDETYEEGHLSGTVYHGGKDHTKFVNRIMELYQWTNPLHIDTFNAVRKMEAEIVQMVVHMFHGDTHRKDACGALTSGGTESICMAVKAHRDWGREEKGIQRPNIVVPVTAHPAFDKACHYYGLEIIKVPVDAKVGSVNPKELERYITSSTVLIVGSAPNFPYGTVDPISELGALAEKYNIGLHVDACLGGFVVQFMEQADLPLTHMVDFRVPGVTSISCDTHKFGYAPKGTSTVLYHSQALRRYQFFAVGDWPGGLYGSPGQSGSKPGNSIAATWAVMVALGEQGYVDATRKIVQNLYKVISGLKKMPYIQVLGNPSVCAISFTSDFVDIYKVNETLSKEYGWKLNPLQFPSGIQFSLTLLHSEPGIIENFLEDLEQVVLAQAKERQALGDKAEPIGEQGATVYGSQQRVYDRSILIDVLKGCFDQYYATHHPVKESKLVQN